MTLKPESEKIQAAFTSVVAAVALTLFKVIIGLLTNSLGILSEAAHSGFDLVAAIITLFAVRLSDKPADPQHLYGHGKVENLSALVETLLLLGTCVWIVSEAVDRLFFKSVVVRVSVWSFLVMSVSIVVDVNRSRMLYRIARKYNSQALEADALHFQTDIWSSAVVLLGLIGVFVGTRFSGLNFLEKLDSVAALGVALIVIVISVQLGKRTIHGLLDSAPKGLSQKIKAEVERLPQVRDCHKIRVRTSGPRLFVDVHVLLDGNQSLDEAHQVTEQIENVIRNLAPGADVTVHPEPDPIGS